MTTSNNFIKGINQDIHPKHQLEGTYRYALNAVVESKLGELPAISNELGTAYCAKDWPDTKILIGHTLTDTDDIVVFLFDPDPDRPLHEIGIYNPTTCQYTTICVDNLLNFSAEHPVNAIFRIRNGCDRYIYFTDNYNKYRVVNITNTTDWVDPIFKNLISERNILFSRDYHWPVLTVHSQYPTSVLDSGGRLEYGVYSFYFRYLDVELNPTNEWIPLTNYIPVGDGSLSNISNNLLLGANNEPSSPLYNIPSTKMIVFGIDEIEQEYKYFQLAVVKKVGLDGSVSSVDVLHPTLIQDFFHNIEYRGLDNEVLFSTDINEILVPNQKIEKVGTHVLNERRMLVGNLTNTPKDYSIYQRFISGIKVSYRATGTDGKISKDPNQYVFEASLDPDEIISLGIVCLHEDGSYSPVFHIPGRPIDSVPNTHINPYFSSYTNWDSDDITGDPNIFNPAKTSRWQVYSTASIDPAASDVDTYYGLMGYYQTPTKYPDIESCDGQPYWGQDWQGNDITTNTYIRHHRTPPQSLYKSIRDNFSDLASHEQYKINIVLDNVIFPTDKVTGIFLVIGDRTEERTILDRGLLKPLDYDIDDDAFYFSNASWYINYLPDNLSKVKYYSFVSPNTLFKSKMYAGDYITVEKRLNIHPLISNTTINPAGSTAIPVSEFATTVTTDSRIMEYNRFTRTEKINYPITNSLFLHKGSITGAGNDTGISVSSGAFTQSESGDRLENRSKNSDVAIYTLNTYLDILNELTFAGSGSYSDFKRENLLVTVKSDVDVFTNLSNITYRRLSPTIIKTSVSTIYDNGGDMFVPYLDILDWYWLNQAVDAYAVSAQTVSSINTEYRYYSSIDRGKFTFFRTSGNYPHKLLGQYMASKYYEVVANQASWYPEYYEINDNYNNLLIENKYYPIPYNYKFCDPCVESFPYRIYYSELDNEESKADNLRIIKVNNYTNIEGDQGAITDLAITFNQLYLFSERASKRIPIRTQTLQSNENALYIGTGEVLSISPIDMKSVDWALSGMPNFKHKTNTEFGLVYIDPLSRKPFLLSNQLSDLSINGLRNFWQENGDLKFVTQYKELTSLDYSILYTTSPIGVGYNLTFDPRFKRVIIHKKDYEILKQYTPNFKYSVVPITNEDTLWFDGTKYYYNPDNSTTIEVTFGDPEYFENKSFTLSYSFITNAWVSFHSYFPYYMMNDYKTFYSNGPNKHNEDLHQTYYNIKHPFVLDLIAVQNPLDAKLSTNIFYTANVSYYDYSKKSFVDVPNQTFDSCIIYNTNQTTGNQNLLLKSTPFQNDLGNSTILVDKVDNKYRISDIRDLSISNSSSIWSYVLDDKLPMFYIDRVPNQNNIDYSKSYYEQTRFRDHFLGVRFFFNSIYNYKITTDIINTQYANRNR